MSDAGSDVDTSGGLASLRYRSRTHVAAVLIAGVVGLLLVSFHWAGLVLAGGLIGLVSRNLREALLVSLGFGVVVIAIFLGFHLAIVDRVLAMEPIIYVTVASALALPVLSSLVRGIVD